VTETPSKYVAKTRKWEKKSWLQEKYWGELLSGRAIAELTDVSETKIRESLREHGIPRRPNTYRKDSSISPFAQFYHNESARTDEESRTQYDPDFEPNRNELNWQKIAKKDNAISDKAVLQE
jgi:hypothetical protein